jgi:excisionase family DNA binding protein
MTKKVLNLTEVAEYLGIKKRNLYDMIADRRFPVEPIKGTKPRLWNIDAIEAWRAAQ